MLRDVKELKDITDDEFNKIIKPFDKEVNKYIAKNIVNQFVAYYIATGYKFNALWDSNFKLTVDQATNEFAQFIDDGYDLNKIKSMLEKEYGLRVISDKPFRIEEINERK